MKKKKILKGILKYIIIFIIMLVIFCTSMIITYALPNERIREHIKESENYILQTTSTPLFSEYIKNAELDQFTDLLILNTAINKGKEEGESVFIRAFENSRYLEESEDQYISIEQSLDDESIYNNQEYSRYWHGIQTILRPLLLIFNYEEIRYLFMLIMALLLAIAMVFIYKNFNVIHSLIFLFSMITVGFFIIPISLQYVGAFAIMLITVILVNVLHRVKKERLYPYIFFIVGGCTSFFDLLTVPLLTLGVPLIYVILLKNKNSSKVKNIIIEVIKLSILWCLSYALIFLSKWLIASAILQKNIVVQAINQILFRTNGSSEYPMTRLGAIKNNLGYLYNTVTMMFLIIITISWIIMMIKNRKKLSEIKGIIPIILVSLYPYIWYFVFAGHSTIHAWFTFRLQAITLLGILSAMLECVNINKINKKDKGNE